MKIRIIILLITSACLTASAQQQYWQQQVDYTIDVSLNDKDHSLDGFVKMQYSNHSPDTLTFIWIHCWPNAYKNDRTAFSEQLLGNGRTDFYFSGKEEKGYLNHLDFRVDGIVAKTEDHPEYIDIVRIMLPHPLLPGGQITITTPFHVKLPHNFSRGGYTALPDGNTYQITQWYPKPAVYDRKGWHPIPYLDQGEFYSEYGNFDVRITVPQSFTVAATGELQNAPGLQESPPASIVTPLPVPAKKTHRPAPQYHHPIKKTIPVPAANRVSGIPARQAPQPQEQTKTLQYRQTRIHDFAWFADKHFHVDHDTLQLPSGRIIDIYGFYKPSSANIWKNSTRYIKDALSFRSALIGEYPFNVVTAAEINMGSPGGMEYPTITGITHCSTGRELDMTIEHEVGHNWFYAILGTNERRYPWMDEGINTYYDDRYETLKYKSSPTGLVIVPPGSSNKPDHANNDWLLLKMPSNQEELYVNTLAKEGRDQPISTSSEDFTATNYDLIAYTKTGLWMRRLQDSLGTPLFDSCMQHYFFDWQFRHPYPEDFRAEIEGTSHRQLPTLFSLLDKKGPVTPFRTHRPLKPTFLFSARNTDNFDYINLAPAIGFNKYDRFMVGALIHNYNLPPDPFQFIIAPLYATGSHQLNGIGRLSYSWFPSGAGHTAGSIAGSAVQKVELGLSGGRFSTLSGTDSNGNKLFGGFYKVVPSARLTFRNASPRSTQKDWVEWKTYLIGEKALDKYVLKTSDSSYYPTAGKYAFRYLNQLTLNIQDERVLYPYRALLQFQQAASFYRVNFTGNYFFNYEDGGGMDLRVFAAKFGYLGSRNANQDLTPFMPKLTAVRGSEDYTYSNYFFGRNEFDGFASQQVMMRDGDLKLRTDLFQGLQGRSDNWVASLNLETTLPPSILPGVIPLKIFLDAGTYAEAWQNNPPTSHFLYVGGLELSLFHDILRFYAPLIYSSDFRNQLKTVTEQNTFWKRLSFSIDIQNITFHRIFGNIPL
ncbi:MAG TPA: M1 family metallopeptidase [Puia sp.]|jgi:hypothetical protein